MKAAAHTPGPWLLGEYGDYLGYDCMTGGVRAGPVVLDANNYGQSSQKRDFDMARMMADAALISAAPDLLKAARVALGVLSGEDMNKQALIDALTLLRAAITQATEVGRAMP